MEGFNDNTAQGVSSAVMAQNHPPGTLCFTPTPTDDCKTIFSSCTNLLKAGSPQLQRNQPDICCVAITHPRAGAQHGGKPSGSRWRAGGA